MTVIRQEHVSGSYREIGLAHGESLREEIRSALEFYKQLFAKNEEQNRQQAESFAHIIRRYASHLATEIEGIADGAGLEPFWVYALNARSEMMSLDIPECTVMCSPEKGLMGQNWDFLEFFEPLIFLLNVEHGSGHRILTMTEPGIVAKIGLSSAGVGVCLNLLMAPRSTDGVPIHVVLREVLEAESYDQALARTRASGIGKSGNVMVCSADGRGNNFEFGGDQVDERDLGTSFVHTNHCLFLEEKGMTSGPLHESTVGRLERGQALLESYSTAWDVPAVKAFLDDSTDDKNSAILQPYHDFLGMSHGTVCSVVLDLLAGEMHFRLKPDVTAPFTTYRV